MTNEEIIEQFENAVELIKQDGKDWLDDRDIPILEACIKSLTVLDNIRVEIANLDNLNPTYLSDGIYTVDKFKVLEIIDKYKSGSEPQEEQE